MALLRIRRNVLAGPIGEFQEHMPFTAVRILRVDIPTLMIERRRDRSIGVDVVKANAADMSTITADQRLARFTIAIDHPKPSWLSDNREVIPDAALMR